jgi:Mce-associated membrane protein
VAPAYGSLSQSTSTTEAGKSIEDSVPAYGIGSRQVVSGVYGTIADVTSAGSPPIDLNLPSSAAMPLGTYGPVFASWGKRVAAAVIDGAIGAGTTFLAFGDQAVTVPFIGAAFQPTAVPGVPTTSWTDSGWVVSAVLLMILMQAYLGVTPGKIVMGIAVVHERDARPIGLVQTTVRWLLHILDSILLIGYLRPLWNAQHQTFADSIMATFVLDTRRPRRHRWFAPGGDCVVDPGPPRSWEAPLGPRWWSAVTAICAVACAAGVLFSFASSGSGPLVMSCEMTAADDGPLGLTGGTLSSGNTTTTRLGVTRHAIGPGSQITATWEWGALQPATGVVTLRASFARADGTGARHYDYPVPDGAAQAATVSLPDDSLKDLGDSWTWTQTILVDSVESPGCTAISPG